jgi:hypothetical protein
VALTIWGELVRGHQQRTSGYAGKEDAGQGHGGVAHLCLHVGLDRGTGEVAHQLQVPAHLDQGRAEGQQLRDDHFIHTLALRSPLRVRW